jgi:hypothetical protein
MKKVLWINCGMLVMMLLAGAFMIFANPAPAQERQREREGTQMQEQDWIYGSQLMTGQEREEYRERMRNAKSYEERERLRNEHHERMMERARDRGMTLPDEPPERGMGRGMGPDSGMGHGMGSGGGMGQSGGRGMGKMGR